MSASVIVLRYHIVQLKIQGPDNKAGIQQEDSQTKRCTESMFEWWLGGDRRRWGEGEEVIKGNRQTMGACSQPMMEKITSKAKLRYLGA